MSVYISFSEYRIIASSLKTTHPDSQLTKRLSEAVEKADSYQLGDRLYTDGFGYGRIIEILDTHYEIALDTPVYDPREHVEIKTASVYKSELMRKG